MNRELQGWWARVVRFIAIAFTSFQLYTAGFGYLPDMQQRAVHVALGLIVTLALVSPRKRVEKKIPVFDLILISWAVISCANAFLKYEVFLFEFGATTPQDLFLGACLIILVMEAGRRTTGWAFPLLTLCALIYAVYGSYVPGMFSHAGFKPVFVIRNLYQSWQGIWGSVTGISATLLAVFIIYGAFILETGAGNTFMQIANKIAGGVRGGPALIAVIASSLFGTISGSAAANVAGTGNFTIPLMKRLGYRPEFAGAVEAVASSGGQIMPPVMGAGAFIMAEFLGISYFKVCLAAAVPACLYYLFVAIMVRLEALRLNLPAVPRNEIVPTREILNFPKLGPLGISIALLFVYIVQGYDAGYAAFIACVSLIVLYLFSDLSLTYMKQRLVRIIAAFEKGGLALIQIVSLCVCANIVIALINQTGSGVKFSELILSGAGGSLFLSLILTAILALILGMGVPTATAYILAVTVVGPPLIKLGLMPIAAHLFVFYFAIISAITPPVCIASYTASAIAKASYIDISKIALRLGLLAYILPFLFVYYPAFLLKDSLSAIFFHIVLAIVGALFIGSGIVGYLTAKVTLLPRIMFFLAGALFFIPTKQYLLTALGLLAIGFLFQWFKYRSKTSEELSPAKQSE